MKNKKRLLMIFLFAFMIIMFILFVNNMNFSSSLCDDILFLRFFQNSEKENELNNMPVQYVFDVSWKNVNFSNASLIGALDAKNVIEEKIAPGLEGVFDIIIKSNHNTKYSVEFKSKNEKPKNLRFQDIDTKKEADSLEDLQNFLCGSIKKNEVKKISVRWYWPYESSSENDVQDTIDSEKIINYVFDIYVAGEAI